MDHKYSKHSEVSKYSHFKNYNRTNEIAGIPAWYIVKYDRNFKTKLVLYISTLLTWNDTMETTCTFWVVDKGIKPRGQWEGIESGRWESGINDRKRGSKYWKSKQNEGRT